MDSNARVLIVDLSEVSMLGTTVALALENLIRDAISAQTQVIVAGAGDEEIQRFHTLGVMEGEEVAPDRAEALRRSLQMLERMD